MTAGRMGTASSKKTTATAAASTKLCCYHLRGKCKFGAKCRFRHAAGPGACQFAVCDFGHRDPDPTDAAPPRTPKVTPVPKDDEWTPADASPPMGATRVTPPESLTLAGTGAKDEIRSDSSQGKVYKLNRELGRGAFGRVFECQDAAGAAWACKIVEKTRLKTEKSVKQLQKEIATMKALRHTHVLQLREVIDVGNRFCLILELIPDAHTLLNLVDSGGDLAKIRQVDEGAVKHIFQQLRAGLRFCHRHHVAHRDVKLENILLKDGVVKIADFGLANWQGGDRGDSVLKTMGVGTAEYRAPEVLNAAEREYDGFAADAFSAGVLLTTLLTGRFPPRDRHGFVHFGARMFSPVSAEAMALLRLLMAADPAKRLAAWNDDGAHPWLADSAALDLGASVDNVAEAAALSNGHTARAFRHEATVLLPAACADGDAEGEVAPVCLGPAGAKMATLHARLTAPGAEAAGLRLRDAATVADRPDDAVVSVQARAGGGAGAVVVVELSVAPGGNGADVVRIAHARGGDAVAFLAVAQAVARALYVPLAPVA